MATLSAKYPHTPSLKRSRIEHFHTRLTSSLATTRRFSPPRSQIALDSASTLSQIQIAPPSKEDCTAMHTLLDQLYKEDDHLSTKLKEKRSHSHQYEQQQPRGQIMVDKVIPIPKRVRDAYQTAQSDLRDEGKVNFLQGLLEGCGFIYYAVQRRVFFFDLNNFDQKDEGHELELPQRPLSALFGIQQLRLGKPYLNYSRQVLLFLQPYEAQIFEFEVREGRSQRKLELIEVETRLPLPRKKVESLILTKEEGLLYCPDQNGHLCIIQPESILPWTKKELSIKKLPESIKALWKGTAKQLTASLRHFGKTIKNYTSSLFSERQIPTKCLYDPHRKLLFVLIGNSSYQLRIYQQQSGKMSGKITNDELLGKSNIDTILAAITINPALNSQYNVALYLSSGKRLYLDLNADSIRRNYIVKPPNPSSKNIDKIDLERFAIFKECYAVHLKYAERRWNCFVTEDMGSGKPEKMYGVELEMLGGPKENDYILLHRDRENLGPGKKSLLCQSSEIMISHEWIRQIFFYAQEFVLVTDQSSQRVRILRPIDILYSLVAGLSHSAQVLAAIPYAFPTVSAIQIVSLCTQILTDQEGHYILSPTIVYYYRKALYLPNLPNYVQYGTADFFSIDKEQRKRVLELMVDLSCEGERRNRNEKEQLLAEGIMTYIARLFRGVMITKVSRITCDCCRVAINNLIEIRGLVQKLNMLLRGQGGIALQQVLGWIERARQLFMLISTLPTLPLMTFAESMSADPSIFHAHLFSFLTRNCQTPISDELAQALPLYCSSTFIRMYRLYNQIRILNDQTVIVNICNEHMPLPEYLIDYLHNTKKIYELRNQEKKKIEVDKEDPSELIKLASGIETKLHEKDIILERASQILNKQNKNKADHEETDKLNKEIVLMKSKIKMQSLLRNAYAQHQHLKNSRITQRLSGLIRNPKKQSKQNQIIYNLQRCLFDEENLLIFADSLALPELKAAHAAIFNPLELPSTLLLLAEQTQAKHKGNPTKLIEQFKKMINFLLVGSKISIPVQQLLEVYVEVMMKWEVVINKMKSQEGVLEEWIWWPFWWLAQIGQPVLAIYCWIEEKLKQIDLRNDEEDKSKKIYLKAGYYYLVKEYLPSHRNQISALLQLETDHPLLIKVNLLLLSLIKA